MELLIFVPTYKSASLMLFALRRQSVNHTLTHSISSPLIAVQKHVRPPEPTEVFSRLDSVDVIVSVLILDMPCAFVSESLTFLRRIFTGPVEVQ